MQAVRVRLGRLKREEMEEEVWQRAKEERQRAKADEEELGHVKVNKRRLGPALAKKIKRM